MNTFAEHKSLSYLIEARTRSQDSDIRSRSSIGGIEGIIEESEIQSVMHAKTKI